MYFAAVEVNDITDLPKGMKIKTIPKNKYAFINYKGTIHGIGEVYNYY